jgi:redox-sensing transcriptional repressor
METVPCIISLFVLAWARSDLQSERASGAASDRRIRRVDPGWRRSEVHRLAVNSTVIRHGPLRQFSSIHIERLMHYYRSLVPAGPGGGKTFTSAQLARLLRVDDSQVRKDLALIGVRGSPRLGFDTSGAREAIRGFLGLNETRKAVVVGAGHLGSALASYDGFADYGLSLAGIFDVSPERIGLRVKGLVVQPLDQLKATIKREHAEIAMITAPAAAAQEVADLLKDSGVRAIWNFAPADLVVPGHIHVRNEHISVGYGELARHLMQKPALRKVDLRGHT